MTIQPHWAYYNTVLKLVKDHGGLHRKKLRELARDSAGISSEEYEEVNARGTNIFNSRIHWASMDMVGIGAFERTGRGIVAITDFGSKLLADHPAGLSRKEIESLPEWTKWKENWGQRSSKPAKDLSEEETNDQTPDEKLDSAIEELTRNLAGELVKKIQSLKPVALEKLVLQLLHAMGYGDSEEALQHLGGSGDEGVDGVISLDRLGLQKIYVQAKRYKDESAITPNTIQAFAGAIHSKGAVGGVFITTSGFTKLAIEAAKKSKIPIELIDGLSLGNLLIKHNVGIRVLHTFHRAELDESHFEDLES